MPRMMRVLGRKVPSRTTGTVPADHRAHVVSFSPEANRALVLQGRARPPRHGIFASLCLLLLAALLSGCGVSSTTGGSAGSPGGATGGTRSPSTSVKPCPGGLADVGSDGTPALILADGAPNQTGSAHVGDLIQVRLPTTLRWSYSSTIAALTPTQHAGDYDHWHNVCFWNFRAQSAGTVKLNFAGTPICQNGAVCPMLVRLAEFIVQIV